MEITEGIIKEVESGNRKIVLDLYHHSFNVLMSSAVRYKNNKEDQMEIVNNAFMKIVTNITKYKPGTAYFSWIKTIVQREIIDDFRKNKRYKDLFKMSDSDTIQDVVVDLRTVHCVVSRYHEIKSQSQFCIVFWQQINKNAEIDVVSTNRIRFCS